MQLGLNFFPEVEKEALLISSSNETMLGLPEVIMANTRLCSGRIQPTTLPDLSSFCRGQRGELHKGMTEAVVLKYLSL